MLYQIKADIHERERGGGVEEGVKEIWLQPVLHSTPAN